MNPAIILSAVRTPVGRYLGALKTVEAYDLAALVLDAAIKRINISAGEVDEVIMGQSYQNGEYVNIARMALLKAWVPASLVAMRVPSMSNNKVFMGVSCCDFRVFSADVRHVGRLQ